jgi:NADH-quinone oxidoreductase subunit J
MITDLFFYYFSAATIVSGLLVVLLRNPVQCGLALLSVLAHMAGFFILLNAEFIAMIQVIVYAGAILILYLFVIMLLNLKSEERVLHPRWPLALFFILLAAGELVALLLLSPFAGMLGLTGPDVIASVGNSHAVGLKLFSDYLLQFEIIGVFLLGAVIGAIVLAKSSASYVGGQPGGNLPPHTPNVYAQSPSNAGGQPGGSLAPHAPGATQRMPLDVGGLPGGNQSPHAPGVAPPHS